jgi:hypothetical protein
VIVASTPWVSVGICYVVVFGSVGLLAWRSRQRGRQLAQQVPEDQRQWMTMTAEPSPSGRWVGSADVGSSDDR